MCVFLLLTPDAYRARLVVDVLVAEAQAEDASRASRKAAREVSYRGCENQDKGITAVASHFGVRLVSTGW